MLSPADAALAARDPAIPGLAVLLDPEAFATALRSALPDAEIKSVTPWYVRYKPGTNCLVAYHLSCPTGLTKVYARAYSTGLRGKLKHAERLREQPGALGVGGLALDTHSIAVYSWPYDHELPALPRILAPSERAGLLAGASGERADLLEADLVHLRYRPARRYVGRLVGAEGGDALLKLYCGRDYARARAAATAFRSAGPLRLAATLGGSEEHRVIVFPWLPGRPLAERLWDDACDPAAVRLTGAALATLHSRPSGALPRNAADPPLAELVAGAGALATICPELTVRVRRLCAALSDALQDGPASERPLHGDFYADQVLIGDDGATLLDLDNAHWGDPAADLGTFAAHLRRAVALGRGTAHDAALLTEALCEGYAEGAAPPASARVQLHTALGLLRLAPEPFRYRAPDWPVRVAALVAAAEDTLAGRLVRRRVDQTPWEVALG